MRVAVVDDPAESAHDAGGIDFFLRRPVDRTVLRLLLSHLAYQGPERRWERRVPVGARVWFFAGGWPQRATLVELSAGGCRLVCKHGVAPNASTIIRLPRRLTGDKGCWLFGRAQRSARLPEPDALHSVALTFRWVSDRTALALRHILETHGSSTRTDATAVPARAQPSDANGDAEVVPPRAWAESVDQVDFTRIFEPGEAPEDDADEMVPESGAASDAASSPPESRRASPRREYRRRVIARCAARPQVLLGRDLSAGGMRVDPTPGLALGDRVQVAVYGAAGSTPLVVDAEVLRDDGQAGLAMGFPELSPGQADALTKVLDALPQLAAQSDGRVVMTELIRDDADADG